MAVIKTNSEQTGAACPVFIKGRSRPWGTPAFFLDKKRHSP